jgi:hypothetical protein
MSTTKEHLDKHRNDTASDSTQKPSDLTQLGFNHGKANAVFVQFALKTVSLLLAFLTGDKNLFQPVNVVIFESHTPHTALEVIFVRWIVHNAKCYQQRQQDIQQAIDSARNVNAAKFLGAKYDQCTDGQPHCPTLKTIQKFFHFVFLLNFF